MSAEELREPRAPGRRSRAALRAIHELGEPLPTELRLVPDRRDLRARPRAARGATLPHAYERGARARAAQIEAALAGPEHEPVPCHNDLLAAQLHRRTASGLWIVDWEYAGMGDRYFDLANFAVNNELDDGGRGGAARAPTSASRRRRRGSPRCG